ncbi:hypothetical protein SGPA1_31354 [Streptomyces misionensis JCM 4497]
MRRPGASAFPGTGEGCRTPPEYGTPDRARPAEGRGAVGRGAVG